MSTGGDLSTPEEFAHAIGPSGHLTGENPVAERPLRMHAPRFHTPHPPMAPATSAAGIPAGHSPRQPATKVLLRGARIACGAAGVCYLVGGVLFMIGGLGGLDAEISGSGGRWWRPVLVLAAVHGVQAVLGAWTSVVLVITAFISRPARHPAKPDRTALHHPTGPLPATSEFVGAAIASGVVTMPVLIPGVWWLPLFL